jgi:hypothetical protein
MWNPKKRGDYMNIPYKIIILTLMLCIGFVPNSTGASFEPAKTALYLGDDNPRNYSLLQYAIEHGSNQEKNSISHGTNYNAGVIIDGYAGIQNHDTLSIHHLIRDHLTYKVPFNLIGLLFTQQRAVEKI